jgi:PAS domain S-box-containing protein
MADAYLRNARHCYQSWGADGKVAQLDQRYPQLSGKEPAPGPTSTIRASVEHLDLSTVLKVSQAVSGEIMLDKLLDTLMRTAIENAGAERGLLTFSCGSEQRIEAEAMTCGDTIDVRLCDEPLTAQALPEAIVQTVVRTQEARIFDDAAAEPALATDPYIRQRQARSILCLPLINQNKLIGVLYLENNLAPGVFTPLRTSVLRLIASQAAIALENTRLYHDLAEREAKIRRLVDANIIGIVFWDLEGPILGANDAFLRIVGYDREDLVAGRLRWTEMTPPEWRDRHERWWTPELKMTGSVQPFEKEYFRKDGSRVPVLVGSTSFDDARNHGVSFVLDLSERKRAEEELRCSREQLAQASRIATVAELSASIAHELNQPLQAVVANGHACMRWLAAAPPNIDEARRIAKQVVSDAHAASDVIRRIRALFKQAAPAKTHLDVNRLILRVCALMSDEIHVDGISLKTELAEDVPMINADAVQIQQVMVNLLRNAIEASAATAERSKPLMIRSRRDGDEVVVDVQDHGIGLADCKTIFEPFVTTKETGMGMGLAICQSIIEAHGGRIWVVRNEAQGVTFSFSLPIDISDVA